MRQHSTPNKPIFTPGATPKASQPQVRSLISQHSAQKLSELLVQAKAPLEAELSTALLSVDKILTLFFSFTDGLQRATVVQFSGKNLAEVWKKLADWQQRKFQESPKVRWLRIDWVTEKRAMPWADCLKEMHSVKRNYFRYGVSLDANFRYAFLEQELNANAMLYLGANQPKAALNKKNFLSYGVKRYGKHFSLPALQNQALLFTTQAILVQPDQPYELLHGYSGGQEGRNTGRRVIEELNPIQVTSLIQQSSQFLAEQVDPKGRFIYGIHPCFDREIKAYNTLRHTSTTYSMLEAWEVTQSSELKSAIDRSIQYLVNDLIHQYVLPSGETLAYLQDENNEIKLGGNAVCLLALVKYTELTNDQQYLSLMEQLALGIQRMQNQKNGQLYHVLNADDLSIKEEFRIIYYDGEAAFGLMRLYGLTKDERWLNTVENAFEYFIEQEHWKIHDHWLSYCVNELTLYRPAERYYQFGIKNVSGHLDFVMGRITTFPTLLELMMAAHKMITRLKNSDQHRHLLNQIDLKKFYRALEARAHYLLNGFFWPEIAMYFQNPQRILGSFFIRHHSFRVRIDDVEHYLSGYVALLMHYLNSPPEKRVVLTSSPSKSLDKTSSPDALKPDVGLLMYPASPQNFPEAEAIARESVSHGISIAYFSYKTINSTDDIFPSYVYKNGKWIKATCHIPPIIDNAPARNKTEESILDHISSLSFSLCQKLEGKKVTTDILSKNTAISQNLIPSKELSMKSLDLLLNKGKKAIIKPHRGQRGKNILLIEKDNAGNYLVKTNQECQQLRYEAMQQLIDKKPAAHWWLQQYIKSQDSENNDFDIRVPLFRAKNGEWRIAKNYVRLGKGEVTSNLATGGKALNTHDFLQENFSAKTATSVIRKLEKIAYAVAETIQNHSNFTIDALGCDFGIDRGKIYLFEINAYPGIKGCLQEAAAAKAEYYQFLTMLKRQSNLIKSNNQNILLHQKKNIIKKIDSLTFATTKENQLCLADIISQGENNYSNSGFLIKGLGNPCYLMLKKEALNQGLTTKLVNNTHVEVYHEKSLIGCTSPNSPNTAFASFNTTKNKARTKKILLTAGLPTPVGRVFKSLDEAQVYFSTCNRSQVVKPLNGGGGKGVTSNINNPETFKYAWFQATLYGKYILVEDFAEGDELRIIVLNGETLAAVCRIPAYVVGNGIDSIRELINRKNEVRKKNPLLKVYPITAFDYLTKIQNRSLDEVPTSDEYVRLATTSNVGLGGEAVSLIDVLHPSFLALARRIFNAIPGATQLGLDIIAKDFTADAWEQGAMIIEVNSDPAIGTPRFASFGPPAEAIAKQVISYIHRTHQERKEQLALTKQTAPSLRPARIYRPACEGRSFPRQYATQILLLRQAAYVLGLGVGVIDGVTTLISSSSCQQLFLYGVPQGTLRVARRSTNDKRWTKQLLADAGLPAPRGKSFSSKDSEPAWAYAQELGLPVVVKPIAGSGGSGVTTNINTSGQFCSAWSQASVDKTPAILVEEQINGNDYRVVVVGHRLVAAAMREPAHVVGDGTSTINKLIATKNQQRKYNPYHGAKTIKLTENILAHLDQAGLTPHSVPEKSQYVQLHAVANIGSGGESIDVTDSVHPDWAEIAVNARKAAFNAPYAGLDIMAEDIARAPSTQKWTIIEINLNPDFGVNHFPMYGQGRDVAGALLAHIFAGKLENQPERRTVRAIIEGKVQNVGFRNWLWRIANQKAISGWVRNLANDRVEAVLEGTPTALASIELALHKGPAKAQVSCVSIAPNAEPLNASGFTII